MSGISRASGAGLRWKLTDHLSAEIPDIFIPPTQVGNAEVRRGRNENS